jgi:heme/copper-type cytochrome/quinol oxidase subunit 4
MAAKNIILLFVLYGGLSIAALLFLLLGFAMARTRLEVIFVAGLAGALVAVHLVELYFLFGLRRAWGGDGDDPLVIGGALIALIAVAANAVFIARKLPPRAR